MEQLPKIMDACTMVTASYEAKNYVRRCVEHAEELQADPRKEDRLKRQECIACYYRGRIGGAAITSRACGWCGEVVIYPSTCTDALCLECAKQQGLCKHCGGDINMRVRHKWPEKAKSKGD